MSIPNLKLAYMGLTLVMIILLLIIGIKTINKSFPGSTVRKKTMLISGLILWQLYVYLMGKTSFLNDFSFPPRFFVFLILPLFIFTGVFLYKNKDKDWIGTIPEHWLVFYQSFRIIIESIFVVSVAHGILNKEVTIEGYNFDMVYAYTAPIIGFLMIRKLISKKILLFWNYVGLMVIASIIILFLSSIFNPELFGSKTMLLPESAVKYPYLLVAGFLMPSAVFIHVLSIVQLRRKKNKPLN